MFGRTWIWSRPNLTLDRFNHCLTMAPFSQQWQPVFVANRVAEILQHSSANKWRHLEGKLNPAAIGTRGMTPEKLQLSFQEEPKPVMRRVKWEIFGSFKKLIRALSYWFRWKKRKSEGTLTVEEFNEAKLAVLKRRFSEGKMFSWCLRKNF